MASLLLLATSRDLRAQDVAKQEPGAHKPARVAVLYFDYSGTDEDMGFLRKGLAQMLVTDLSESMELVLVERTDLEAVLKELELGTTKKIDRSSANKIGKLLGAQYLVTGGYFTFKNRMRVDAKIIDVETGVTKGIGVSKNPDNFLALESELAGKLLRGLIKANQSRTNTPTGKRAKAQNLHPAKAKKLPATTVARYGRALDAIDQGDKKLALQELSAITSATPDFKPAAEDLRVLLR